MWQTLHSVSTASILKVQSVHQQHSQHLGACWKLRITLTEGSIYWYDQMCQPHQTSTAFIERILFFSFVK